MKLLLDDVRSPNECYYTATIKDPAYLEKGWEIVRSHDEFVNFFKKLDRGEWPEIVSFDHDLCHEHYQCWAETQAGTFNGIDVYEKCETPTGLSSLKHLHILAMELNRPLPKIIFHTFSDLGRSRLINYYEKEMVGKA